MNRVDEWIGGQGRPGSRLVRMQRGETRQSFNVCRSSNVLGDYETKYLIRDPEHFMSTRDFTMCKTLDELVEKILRHHGEKQEV